VLAHNKEHFVKNAQTRGGTAKFSSSVPFARDRGFFILHSFCANGKKKMDEENLDENKQ